MKIDKIISFDISSDFGFFKKPDVNKLYLTYNIIPKPTLLGLLGAIIGLDGYSQMKNSDKFPKFYEELKELKVAIKPYGDKGVYQKRVIKYNNSVGYANKDGNLIVAEQTLINPKYTIFLALDFNNTFHKKIYEYLSKPIIEYEYIPYMGKNEFMLFIDNFKEFKNFELFKMGSDFSIYTIFENKIESAIKSNRASGDPFNDMKNNFFYYYENLPIKFDESLLQYELLGFVYTNAKFLKDSDFSKLNLFKVEDKVICLF